MNAPALMAAAIEPFILRLPNEVLECIFSFISYFEWCPGGRGPDRDGRDFGGVTLFALSHVCRNFRRVIQNSPFWLAKSFEVGYFRKGGYWARGGPAPPRDNFLAALLSDSNLCRCLQLKRDWEFSTPRGLEIVAGAVKDFCQIAESITFIGGGTTKVQDLRFPCTTSLDLMCSELDDLDFIGKRFRALKQFRTFTALSTKLSGSLKSLPFVEDLDIIGGRLNGDIIGDADLQNIKNLALTVPSLTFSISEFSNLQSLRLVMPLHSLRGALDNDGKEFNFTLLQARVVIRAEPSDGPLPSIIFPSGDLGRLRKLVLSIHVPVYWTVPFPVRHSTQLLESISHLRNLKELAIGGPADPCGAKHLGRLENLERLDWTLLRESKPEPPSEGSFFRTELEERMYDDFMVNPMKFMESVFERFSRLPTMTVEVARDGFPDRWW